MAIYTNILTIDLFVIPQKYMQTAIYKCDRRF